MQRVEILSFDDDNTVTGHYSESRTLEKDIINLFHAEKLAITFRIDDLVTSCSVACSTVQISLDWEKTCVLFDTAPDGDTTNLKFKQTSFPIKLKE